MKVFRTLISLEGLFWLKYRGYFIQSKKQKYENEMGLLDLQDTLKSNKEGNKTSKSMQ